MKEQFDDLSHLFSKLITRKYSTSFSLGIYFLDEKLREPIYDIYGFVRLADEIVDSFHHYEKSKLLEKFRQHTTFAIDNKISLNPVLNSFQSVFHKYDMDLELVDTFLNSMEMDLSYNKYNTNEYEDYILGSAEVVGLMCLRVFTENDENLFNKLKPFAMKLGSAFQKINFLRDVKQDYEELGRTYFPYIDMSKFTATEKNEIEKDILSDFEDGLKGIKMLPHSSRKGVYLAYYYYKKLFVKIKKLPPNKILTTRVRISNIEKLYLMIKSMIKYKLNYL